MFLNEGPRRLMMPVVVVMLAGFEHHELRV
jgi:hypothetical protein